MPNGAASADDRAIADAFYTVLSAGIVVVAGLAISAVVLSMAGQQSSSAAGRLDGVGEGGMEKGLYAFYYTVDPSAGLASTDPETVMPGDYLGTRKVPGISLAASDLPANVPSSGVMAIWAGYVAVSTAGYYSFRLESASHSWLWVDGDMIVENHVTNVPTMAYGVPMYLPAGRHAIKAKCFYTSAGGALCHVSINGGSSWSGPVYYR